MQQVVHQMGTPETDAVLGRGLLMEGEVGGEVIIHQETQRIADGIGYVDVDPVLQHPVDGIVDAGRV